MMKVSLIIPIYNVSNYIERCLKSAFNQTYKNIEYILVDDASPDDSIIKAWDIIDKYPNKDVKVTVHSQNKGLSAARNTGVRESTGEYIYFLDSDDALPLDAISVLISYVSAIKPDFVVGEFDIISPYKSNYHKLNLSDGLLLNDNKSISNAFFSHKWYETACGKLLKRELFFEKGCWFYEGILHEDILWSFNLAILAVSMIACTKPTYQYYINSNSITQNKSDRNFDSMEIVFAEIIKIIEEKNIRLSSYLVDYLANQKIYFFKELLRVENDLLEINVRIKHINCIFEHIDRVLFLRCSSFSSFLKLLAYKLPIRLAVFYVRFSL